MEGLKATIISTVTARKGIAIFHIMIALLDFARLPTPRRFMMVNTPMRATEKTIPSAVRTSVPPWLTIIQGNH